VSGGSGRDMLTNVDSAVVKRNRINHKGEEGAQRMVIREIPLLVVSGLIPAALPRL
jgi:hypothetical protein